jgi:hypothetical protein
MLPDRAARNSAIDLLSALVLATVAAVSIWYFTGDSKSDETAPGPLKGELAVRLGAESLGIPALGNRADLWYFGEWRQFVAADNPANDDRLVTWLAAQPGVSNVRASRKSSAQGLDRDHFDTTLKIRYDRPGELGLAPIDWPAFGYRLPKDDAVMLMAGQIGGPKVHLGHSRGVLWLIAVACVHVALLVVVLVRGSIWLFRRRTPILPAEASTAVLDFDIDPGDESLSAPPITPPAEALPTARVFPLVMVSTIVLLGLVVVHERLVATIIPHATARGWVWFSSFGWKNTETECERIYLVFLAAPLAAQLFFRYFLVGRWRAAGRPAIGVLLTAVAFAFLWLDLSLAPLGLAVGGILGWLALRGVPVVGLFALHALVNGAVFAFLLTDRAPPDGHDPRLDGSWLQVEGSPKTWHGRIAFTADGRVIVPAFCNNRVPSEESVEWYYLALDHDRLLVGVGGNTGKFRIAFEGDELIFTPVHRSPAEPFDRYRRK